MTRLPTGVAGDRRTPTRRVGLRPRHTTAVRLLASRGVLVGATTVAMAAAAFVVSVLVNPGSALP